MLQQVVYMAGLSDLLMGERMDGLVDIVHDMCAFDGDAFDGVLGR